jgi:thioredoxin-like negative regulator of GroEL
MRTRLLIILAIFVGGGPLTAEITWHESLDEAKIVSAEKPVVLYFTDEACVWCRRLESSTFPSEEVLAIADKFLFVKLDVDDAEELAARYRARGVPYLVVLDAKGKVLARQAGYSPAAPFAKFLDESLTNPSPPETDLDAVLDAWAELGDETPDKELVERTVARRAGSDRALRGELVQSLAGHAQDVRPHLVELLASSKLAIRAAAYEVLKKITRDRHPFDPFAPVDVREDQRQAWVSEKPDQAPNE